MKDPLVPTKSFTRYATRLAVIALFAGLLSLVSFGSARAATPPSLDTAANFAVLGGTAVTCTESIVSGDVGVALVSGAFTDTNCTILNGATHVGNATGAAAYSDFLDAYDELEAESCGTTLTTLDVDQTLLPGVYCFDAAATATGKVLTLDGSSDDTWIFKVGTAAVGALTGTNFLVEMTSGETCNNNVFWWSDQDATLTDSVFIGTILAGADITVTRGSLDGRVMGGGKGTTVTPDGDVTLTNTEVSLDSNCGTAGGGGSGEGALLTPSVDTNIVGEEHTVTATVQDANGDPIAGIVVDFEVLSGPHDGVTGSAATNSNGQATFTYTGTTAGTDSIGATFVDSAGATQKSNRVLKIWEEAPPPADTTAPICELTSVNAGPPAWIEVTVQDDGSGLSEIIVTKATNLTVDIPPFTAGDTSPLVVTATKIDNSKKAQLDLDVIDVAGNVTSCDPVFTLQVRERGKPVSETFTGVLDGTAIVIANGDPGLTNLAITVNGEKFQAAGLKDGEPRTIDISSAASVGDEVTISLEARGRPGGEASVLVPVAE